MMLRLTPAFSALDRLVATILAGVEKSRCPQVAHHLWSQCWTGRGTDRIQVLRNGGRPDRVPGPPSPP